MWIWMNIPLMVLFLVAVAGIPLWMVIKHPDTAPDFRAPGQQTGDYARSRAAQAAMAAQQHDAAAWSQHAVSELDQMRAPATTR
jgi:hypothetical protein